MEYDSEVALDDSPDISLPVAEHDAVIAAHDASLDHVAFAPPLQVSLSSVLNEQPINVNGLVTEPGRPVYDPVQPPWDQEALEPWNLLRRALHEHHPTLYVRCRPERRRRRKCTQDLGTLLKKLQKQPRCMSWRICHDQICAARDEFVRRYAEASAQSWSTIVREAKRIFNAQSREFKNAWTVVNCVAKLMFKVTHGHGRRLVKPPAHAWLPQSLAGDEDRRVLGVSAVFGVLVSWNTDFGLREPALRALIEADVDDDALLQGMLSIPIYKWHFDAFRKRIQHLAVVLDLPSWAACMELSIHAEQRGRVHLHAMFAPTISWSGHARNLRKVSISMSQLVWDGVIPDVRPSAGAGRSRQIAEAFQGGLYYVLCDKLGAMYRDSSVKLFQDMEYRRYISAHTGTLVG